MRRRAAALLLASACTPPVPAITAPHVVTPATVAAAPIVVEPEASAEVADDFVTPCREGSPEHTAAADALAKLARDIDASPLTGDVAPIAERLTSLVEEPCFVGVGSAAELSAGAFGSALSLKTYWREGGQGGLVGRLELGRASEHPYYWLGPSIRTALTTENAPKTHPLAPLLCSGASTSCGRETTGWSMRAASAFRGHARSASAPSKTYESCKEATTFVAFSDCMQSTAVHEDALPLGSFRAPTSGWLVLRGRRGHYNWCNELRAYDLATGSAYIASLCGGMTTSAPPRIDVTRGKLPLDALREAAWMMFLAGVADRNVIVSGEGRAIPTELAIRIPKDQAFGIGIGGFGWSSGRTTLVYQWIRQGKSTATGTVSWPDAYGAAEEHATNLLAIAEAGFVKTCAGIAKLPAIPWAARADKTTRVGDPDRYYPDYVGPEFDDLELELARQAGAACTP
jgi:hypothetical protein